MPRSQEEILDERLDKLELRLETLLTLQKIFSPDALVREILPTAEIVLAALIEQKTMANTDVVIRDLVGELKRYGLSLGTNSRDLPPTRRI